MMKDLIVLFCFVPGKLPFFFSPPDPCQQLNVSLLNKSCFFTIWAEYLNSGVLKQIGGSNESRFSVLLLFVLWFNPSSML